MKTNNYIMRKTNSASARKTVTAGLLIFGAIGFGYSQENTLPDSGNVGIGTTAPTARLQVGGSAKIDSSLVVSDSLHVANSFSVANDARVGADLRVDGDLYLPSLITPTPYPTNLTFLYRDANYIVREGRYEDVTGVLKNLFYAPPLGASQPGFNYCTDSYTASPYWMSGTNKLYTGCPDTKVGIGTDSPAYSLDNRGNSKTGGHAWFATTLSVGADNNNFARLYVKNSASGASLQIDNSGNTNQFTKALYITYTEPTTSLINVQNTTLNYSPFRLDANGTINVANNQGLTTFNLDESGGLTLFSGAQQSLRFEQSGKLTIYNAGQQIFRVETNGFIRGRRLRLDSDIWADYVFEPTYKLMPLSDVEAFISAEKHLPNIPSQKELAENGADVMEMNRLLMEKVEELTLYLIAQNRNMVQLQDELQALKNKVTESQKD